MTADPDWQPRLESERLIVRPLEESDRDALYAVAADPMVWEQHPMHDRWRREVFDKLFDECLASGGSLAVIRKSDDSMVGHSRYDRYDPENGGSVEIGWTFLATACWGKGLNRELKRAMLGHAFRYVARVDFRVGETNYRSRQALDNIGAARDPERYDLDRYQGRRVVHLYYTIDRAGFVEGPLSTD
ncbi:GNAT family N-acetyltransferase [Qipengyuania sp. MTN3-11]|uniref:GNAT family N-acetyltransferase n=1 Tax=Qipengyuania sp. MTN3-11 TaxID=3056557 RepID=UPI0036F3559F